MIEEKKYLTLARSNLSNESKKLLASIFKNHIDELLEILYNKFNYLLPNKMDIENEIDNLITNKISLLTIANKNYPELLKITNDAPITLSVKGNVQLFNQQNIAVVGSRKLENEDFKNIKHLISFLNNLNLHVVSGLAIGSDILSHIHSINNGTIAVIPCGLQHCYPKEHQIIADKIVDMNGAIVSEFCFNEIPQKFNFIHRNKTIVGISNSLIITRAREIRSGTMSNTTFASKYNRNIYTFNLKHHCNGNKYLLENKIAKKIDNFDNLKFNLIKDIMQNQCILDEKCQDTYQDTNFQLFSKHNIPSIKKEIVLISKNLKTPLTLTNICKIYKKCLQEIQYDKKDLMIEILKLIK